MKLITTISLTPLLAMIAGCQLYTPGGNAFSNGPNSASTWESSEEFPKTVTLMDTRSGELLFVMEIPVGKKLVVDFMEDGGDNDVMTPDLMTWEVFPSNVGYGPLSNALTVPNRWSRRIDVAMRTSSEYAQPSTDRPLRVDEINDQPDWWSPAGGELDTADPVSGYDPY